MNKEQVIFKLCQKQADAYKLLMLATELLAEVTGTDPDLVWAEFLSVVQAEHERISKLKAEKP